MEVDPASLMWGDFFYMYLLQIESFLSNRLLVKQNQQLLWNLGNLSLISLQDFI